MPRSQAEYRLQCAVVDLLSIAAAPGVVWSAFPAGEARTVITGARLKRSGLKPGWADLIFCLPPDGRYAGLELKTLKGRPSLVQREVGAAIGLSGGLYHVAYGFADAMAWLNDMGIIRGVRGTKFEKQQEELL